jgi:FKBP-type peptidyl-prolyl cis-trans isomerase
MIKIHQYLFLVLVVTIIAACEDNSSDANQVGTEPVANRTEDNNPNATYNIKGKTASGYEYVHHINNNGPKPQEGDQVSYHKIVSQSDTVLLQSTFMMLEPRRDVMTPRDSLKPPYNPVYEALFLMSPGDSLTVYQPLTNYPADQLPKGVSNSDYFTYKLKMLSIKPKDVIESEIAATIARHESASDSLAQFIKDYKAGKLKDQIIETDSGLKYVIHREGKGKKVKDGGFVKVHYVGMLEDATVFDGSFEKVTPFAARIGRGRVIPGWDEALAIIPEGTEATLIIPYELAYGVEGKPPTIPEKATLFFFVDLIKTY